MGAAEEMATQGISDSRFQIVDCRSDGNKVIGFGRIWPCISSGGRTEDGRWRNEDGGVRSEDRGMKTLEGTQERRERNRKGVGRVFHWGSAYRVVAPGEDHVPVSPPCTDLHRQSSVVRPSISRKCASRVIRVRLCCRAIAAIQMSLSGIGRPCLRRGLLFLGPRFFHCR